MPRNYIALLFVIGLGFPVVSAAQAGPRAASYVPDLQPLVVQATSELRDAVERYRVDRLAMQRRWSVEQSPDTRAQFRAFLSTWRQKLAQLPLERLSQDGKVDYILLGNRLDYELRRLARQPDVLVVGGGTLRAGVSAES
jgi:hypothetical protein